MNRFIAALGAVLSAALVAAFSLPAASQERTVEGVIEIIHVDAVPPYFLHLLTTPDGEVIELEFSAPPGLRSGSAVRVRGRSDEHRHLKVDDAEVILAAPPAITTGEQRVLTLLVNFQDAPLEPWTPATVEASCEGTPNGFYDESSDGQTWFTCETYGWFTIPVNVADCQIGLVSQWADDMALAAGHNPAQYERVAYVTAGAASTSCISASTVGAGAKGYSQTWMINKISWGTWVHELGHALGLYHAHALECGASAILCEPIYGSSHIEYGYYGDIMGVGVAGDMNIFSREYLRWLLLPVATSGTWVLTPIELPDAQGLKVLKSVDPVAGALTYYYIEYRQCIGFDAFLCNITTGNYKDGVVIAIGVEGGDFAFVGGANDNYQLDMTPETVGQYDGALTVGRCFSDSNVAITLLWEDGTRAAVAVDLTGNCQAEPPPPPAATNPPIAVDDRVMLPWGSTAAITVPVLANDSDPDGDALTVIAVEPSGKGSTAIVAGGIRYAPSRGMRGSDSFGYTVSDGRGGTASATVRVSAIR